MYASQYGTNFFLAFSDNGEDDNRGVIIINRAVTDITTTITITVRFGDVVRSEEHTSELQSLTNRV